MLHFLLLLILLLVLALLAFSRIYMKIKNIIFLQYLAIFDFWMLNFCFCLFKQVSYGYVALPYLELVSRTVVLPGTRYGSRVLVRYTAYQYQIIIWVCVVCLFLLNIIEL